MHGDTYWTVDILLPRYTGDLNWGIIHCGDDEETARRILTNTRRDGTKARLRRWTAEVFDADEPDPVPADFPQPRLAH